MISDIIVDMKKTELKRMTQEYERRIDIQNKVNKQAKRICEEKKEQRSGRSHGD
jgi:hypothetical protein